MLFNQTTAGGPDIRAVSTDPGLLKRCEYVILTSGYPPMILVFLSTHIGSGIVWRSISDSNSKLPPVEHHFVQSDIEPPREYPRKDRLDDLVSVAFALVLIRWQARQFVVNGKNVLVHFRGR